MDDEIYPIPLWWDLMTRLEGVAGVGNVVIAGGAVRDFMCDKPAKDIDVFLPAGAFDPDKYPTLETITSAIIRAMGPSAHLLKTNVAKPGSWLSKHSDQTLVATLTLGGRWGTVQIILLSLEPDPLDIFEVLGRVDFGICQCAYARRIPDRSTSPEIVTTPAWVRDYQHRTFTLVRADTEEQREYSRKRFDRIVRSGKYEGWAMVDPLGDLPSGGTMRDTLRYDGG